MVIVKSMVDLLILKGLWMIHIVRIAIQYYQIQILMLSAVLYVGAYWIGKYTTLLTIKEDKG